MTADPTPAPPPFPDCARRVHTILHRAGERRSITDAGLAELEAAVNQIVNADDAIAVWCSAIGVAASIIARDRPDPDTPLAIGALTPDTDGRLTRTSIDQAPPVYAVTMRCIAATVNGDPADAGPLVAGALQSGIEPYELVETAIEVALATFDIDVAIYSEPRR